MEVWKDVLDYEGFYQVSNLGNVKSLPKETKVGLYATRKWGSKLIIPRKGIHGYLYVNLYKNTNRVTKKIHRLVYEAFNGKTDLQIDHIIEGNKTDNRLCNLQELTSRQNISKNRSTKNKASKYTGVTWHKQSNKWCAAIFFNKKRRHIGLFKHEIDAANAYQNYLKQL